MLFFSVDEEGNAFYNASVIQASNLRIYVYIGFIAGNSPMFFVSTISEPMTASNCINIRQLLTFG